MANVNDIEGVGPAMAEKLEGAGIKSIDQLLEAAGSKSGREALAEKAGIPETNILKWINHADLMRINGIGGQYAELLEAAGVDSCAELAQRNGANLAAKMAECNEAKNLTNRVPSETEVAKWIDEAKTMSKVVTH